jgi:16S rRNA G966 N2-methylase RsmD
MAAGNLHITLPGSSVLKRIASSLRRGPAKTSLKSGAPRPRFFDQYPRFYSTSTVSPSPERLHERYRALIAPNEELIRDKSILDLAAHDGRWSFAALKAGARHVTGIEGRAYLVESAIATAQEYGIDAARYRFIVGDLFQEIEQVPTDSIDTVFCFGFFYHTAHHMLLLSKIARLNPKHLILDTEIDETTGDLVVRLKKEKVDREGTSLVGEPGDPMHALVGKPSRSALETMLTSYGWSFTYYDWHRAGIQNWRGLNDYRDGSRVSLVATRATS